MYLVNDRLRLNDDCKISSFNNISTYENEYTIVLPFRNSTKNASPYYDEVVIRLNGNVVFTISDFSISAGLPSVEHKFLIKNIIIDELRANLPNNVTGVYWENYRGKFYPDSFIFVTNSNFNQGVNSITVDGVSVSNPSNQVQGLQLYNYNYTNEVPNRLIKSENLHELLNNNSFFKPNFRSPISSLTKDRLTAYFSKRCIGVSLVIDYIRIPRRISLSLNRTCELSESTHERIIDLAVEYIKNTIEQPSYDLKVKDNILRNE
jgi:hypothetical protein